MKLSDVSDNFGGRNASFDGCRSFSIKVEDLKGNTLHEEGRNTFATVMYIAGRFIEMAKTDSTMLNVKIKDVNGDIVLNSEANNA